MAGFGKPAGADRGDGAPLSRFDAGLTSCPNPSGPSIARLAGRDQAPPGPTETAMTPMETMMAAGERLNALLRENRPFRFLDTTRADAERYLATKARFAGVGAQEIAAAEAALGVTFTDAMRGFFRAFGLAHGQFFTGSDLARIGELARFRQVTEATLAAVEAPVALPRAAVVFMMHQGYVFYWQAGEGGPDAPVRVLTDGPPWEATESAGLLPMIEAQVSQMEALYRMQIEMGGYWLTVREREIREIHPALSERPRPMEIGDRFLD